MWKKNLYLYYFMFYIFWFRPQYNLLACSYRNVTINVNGVTNQPKAYIGLVMTTANMQVYAACPMESSLYLAGTLPW